MPSARRPVKRLFGEPTPGCRDLYRCGRDGPDLRDPRPFGACAPPPCGVAPVTDTLPCPSYRRRRGPLPSRAPPIRPPRRPTGRRLIIVALAGPVWMCARHMPFLHLINWMRANRMPGVPFFLYMTEGGARFAFSELPSNILTEAKLSVNS